MRLVIQRAAQASVTVDGRLVSEIGKGLFILSGINLRNILVLSLPYSMSCNWCRPSHLHKTHNTAEIWKTKRHSN